MVLPEVSIAGSGFVCNTIIFNRVEMHIEAFEKGGAELIDSTCVTMC